MDPAQFVQIRAADAVEKLSRQNAACSNAAESQIMAEILQGYLDDTKSIVKTCTMQGLHAAASCSQLEPFGSRRTKLTLPIP